MVDISSGGSPRPFDGRPFLLITFCSTDISTHLIARHVLMRCPPVWNAFRPIRGLSEFAEIAFTPQTLNVGTQATEVSQWLSSYPTGRIVVLFGGKVTDWVKAGGSDYSAFNPLEVRTPSHMGCNSCKQRSCSSYGITWRKTFSAVFSKDNAPQLCSWMESNLFRTGLAGYP